MTTPGALYTAYLQLSDLMAEPRKASPLALLALRDQIGAMSRENGDDVMTNVIFVCAETALAAVRAADALPADWVERTAAGEDVPEVEKYLLAAARLSGASAVLRSILFGVGSASNLSDDGLN